MTLSNIALLWQQESVFAFRRVPLRIREMEKEKSEGKEEKIEGQEADWAAKSPSVLLMSTSLQSAIYHF